MDFIFTNPITRDYTLYPRWEMTKSYEIKLYCENQTFIQNVRKGQKISKPQVSKEGYHLDTGDDPNGSGWYEGDEGTGGQWNFDTALDETHIPSEAKLTAKWAINKYTVTFDSNGGTGGILTRPNIEHGSTISAPTGAELPTKTGYTLEGWYLNGNKFSFNGELNPTPVKSDITLVAKWKEDYVTVSFKDSDDEGTEIAAPQKVLRAGTLIEPDYTPKEGYTLEGWYTGKSGTGTKWVFGTQGTQVEPSTTETTKALYANWTINKYTVTFDSNGGDTGVKTQTDVPYNSTISAPTTPSKEGYTLKGWYLGDEKFKFVGEESATPVTSDITLVARWNEDPVTVSFMETDGTTEVATAQKVLRGGTLSEPKAVKTGYTIEGWYENDQLTGNKWVFGDSGTKVETTSTLSTKTLYAKWTANTYTVTFDSNGGEFPDSSTTKTKSVDYKGKIGILEAAYIPSRTGYTFAGWTNAGAAFDPATGEVLGDMTLVAQWTEATVVMTFNSNGGSSVPSQTVKKGDKLIEPEVTRPGYSIEGWYTDSGLAAENKWDFANDTVDGTVTTLYANWTINTYTVTFDANGGKFPDDSTTKTKSVDYKGKIGTLEAAYIPSRTGYTFAGWTNAGTAFDPATGEVLGDMTLVAQWTENVPDGITIVCGDNNQIKAGTASASTAITLTKGGTAIVCPGNLFYEISASTLQGGSVSIDPFSGTVTLNPGYYVNDTFTIKVTYKCGTTSLDAEQIVTIIQQQ